ncbi:MAG: hypothetical protein HY518_00670 [Candidatus Aenigmarchaeota archaeon]|nr:hypothetical protein [Candidatus Aenigmarchaeota archaeon]
MAAKSLGKVYIRTSSDEIGELIQRNGKVVFLYGGTDKLLDFLNQERGNCPGLTEGPTVAEQLGFRGLPNYGELKGRIDRYYPEWLRGELR